MVVAIDIQDATLIHPASVVDGHLKKKKKFTVGIHGCHHQLIQCDNTQPKNVQKKPLKEKLTTPLYLSSAASILIPGLTDSGGFSELLQGGCPEAASFRNILYNGDSVSSSNSVKVLTTGQSLSLSANMENTTEFSKVTGLENFLQPKRSYPNIQIVTSLNDLLSRTLSKGYSFRVLKEYEDLIQVFGR